ncbi:MAG: DUF4439 domain-containing protein [Jatrophihabitantaceae bacterium]
MTLIGDWQAALATEQQAGFGYDLLGARLHGTPELSLAVVCSNAHDALIGSVTEQLATAGQTPHPTAADYPSLYPVDNASAARALAIRLETECAAAWRYLYENAASTTGAQAITLRAQAQAALTASAVRATRWRLAAATKPLTTAFPGL